MNMIVNTIVQYFMQLLSLTSGSPVSRFVWMSILPSDTSLQTSDNAGSIVSPARRILTPQIWRTNTNIHTITVATTTVTLHNQLVIAATTWAAIHHYQSWWPTASNGADTEHHFRKTIPKVGDGNWTDGKEGMLKQLVGSWGLSDRRDGTRSNTLNRQNICTPNCDIGLLFV